MHISAFREMKTKTPKEMWKMAWRLQRANKAGRPDFPFMLLMVNNLMEYKGRQNELFRMMGKARTCQYKLYNQVGKLNLQARLYMKKLKSAKNAEFAPDLSCADCSWSGKYEEARNAMCPECESSDLFDSAIPF